MAIPNTLAENHVVEYLEQSISSIEVVQKLSKDKQMQLNPRQCEYLSDKLTETGGFLRAKSESLISIYDSADTRRKALLQLYFAIRRAEKLVRGCCCETEPWLDSAVTLAHVKEDIKDILLDVRWWTSMIDIAIASTTWSRNSSAQEAVLELLMCAEEHYRELLDNLHMSNNDLKMAACRDENLLLRKVRDVETSYAGKDRTAEQNHDYLLAVHVRSRLENCEVETMEELNVYEDSRLIGLGGFGAVLNVKWLGRRCALKMLRQKCKDEATSLREFNHPHIVKFFRYWEAPYVPTPQSTPRGTPHDTPHSDDPMQSYAALQSHILMELLPMDLAQHLVNLRSMVNFTGSKRRPEHTQGASLPEDVALDTMLQMVKVMWHLNSKDVAHRDLKPNNVLVRPVGDDEVPELNYRGYVRAKLADFGLAKTKALSSDLSTQPALGTKIYGAPEVFNKDIISKKKYPRKADVWSFGIMFCEVLSGKAPFPGIEDGTYTLAELQRRIKDGLRPTLPDNCSDYLKFIISSCWELLPENRPNFSDLLRLVRLAQVQSLGLIQKDHDLYFYETRNGVRRLRPFKGAPAPAPAPFVPSEAPGGLLKSNSIWGTIPRWLMRRDVSFQRRLSTGGEVSTSRSQAESKPLGYLVNQVGLSDTSNSKLDVIFFEGNVGRIKDMSCKDTWVQRGKPDVWWPRDWLPKDLGDDIRVLLLEYSISDDGVEDVVDQLQRLLVFSDRWNRGRSWDRPIVLVGHSLGCVVIEHLVVALDRRARSIETLDNDVEIGRARVAEAFLTSLAGCFFYAPPWTGLVPSEGLLKHVFGGLTYSKELFSGLCLDSPKLQLLSEDFMRAKREHMKLTALTEGFHTMGRSVVPVASMQNFAGTYEELGDSNHTDVCKPANKQHKAYRELVVFVSDILENSKAIQFAHVNQQQSLSNGEQNLSTDKQPYFFNEEESSNSRGYFALSGLEGDLSKFSIVEVTSLERGVDSGPVLAFRGVLSSNSELLAAVEVNACSGAVKTREEFLVNQVWPLESSFACESTKLNVIFFEGNVGNRKHMSTEDTWVQRGNSGVCWPQDWLPVDLGDDTRVLLLKYQIRDYSGLERIVTDLQERLIDSDRWNQNREWENPIVLVGHSIGCVVIQNLVVRLHHMNEPIANTSNDLAKMQANTSRAFIKNIIGCFFYAPPLNGFVPSESVLRVVFGGLNFSRDLFWDFAQSSPKLRMLLEEFLLINTTRRIRLGMCLEGKKTGEEMVVVAPVELMNYVLNDSDHSEVCKPTNKDHRSYKEFFDFVLAILPIQGSSNANSHQCVDKSKDSKNSQSSNEDGSFIIVEGPINSFSDDSKLSRNSLNDIHNAEDQEVLILKQRDQYINVSEENQELFSMVKQKINEIDNVVEMQQVDALDFISGESQVLIICNHSDKDNALVFHFLDGQNMAKVVGVGLDYAKIILRNGVDIEVQEIVKSEWESAWFDSKSIENTTYKTLKVTVPMQDDIKPTRVLTQKEHVGTVMARPLLWDVAKYFTLKKILSTLSHSGAEDGAQTSKNGQGQGNGSGNSNDTKTTQALFFYAFRSWFSMNFIRRGGEKDDDDEGQGDGQRGLDKVDDVNGSHANANVKVKLKAEGYVFENCGSTAYSDVQFASKAEDLDIQWDLEFDFSRNEDYKKISLTRADIYFGIRNDHEDDQDDLESDRFGTFHDDLRVYFSVVTEESKPPSAVINQDIKLHGCEQGKTSYGEESIKEKRKGKGHGGTISLGAGIHGVSFGIGGNINRSKSEGDIHTETIISEYSSTFTRGGFNAQEVTSIRKGVMGFKFLAPCSTLEGAHIWSSRDYRNRIRTFPPFQGQRIQFSGSWEPISDEKLAKYQISALRYLGEIMRKEVDARDAPSTSSKIFSFSKSKKASSKHDFKKLLYKQSYEKNLYLNHELTHWVNYVLTEKDDHCLTTTKNSPSPLVALKVAT